MDDETACLCLPDGWMAQVCSVSPTFHQTDMVSASTDSLLRCYDGLGDEVKAEYGPRYRDELAASLDHASR